MTAIVDWVTARARTIVALIILSLAAGGLAYVGLPKEGEPDIDVPALFVRVAYPGISATDAEKLLVKPLEAKLRDLQGLDKMTSTAGEGFAVVILQFEFGWDKAATLAEVRDRVSQAEAEFPEGYKQPTIDEINFSEFPILVVSLSGDVPERTLLRLAKEMQDAIESLPPVLEAGLAGHRDEMLEVIIDPLRMEAYNVTADELLRVVVNNNQLVAAGEIESGPGAFAVKVPASFDEPRDVYDLPVKVNGDRVVTLGDLAEIRLTFEDALGTARYNGQPTIALQIVKRKGENLIETVAAVKAEAEAQMARWPAELREAVTLSYSMDDSTRVASMVSQLESSVLTAIALVMIVVLGSLGIRSALLVGFAIPTSFLLSFALMAVMGMSVSNIVMFGLILAVGMLVDGAIVVVEYADTRIEAGQGPMRAFAEAARRMFWPIVSSTATTLCAFLPMLFWPGMPGEFMGNLPVTLIFVLSAALVVALVYLPVTGGIAGRISRLIDRLSDRARALPLTLRAVLLVAFAAGAAAALLALMRGALALPLAAAVLVPCAMLASAMGAALRRKAPPPVPRAQYRRSLFGRFIHLIVGNPVMPFVAVAAAVAMLIGTMQYYAAHSRGVEFFVKTEPERAVAYVRARGNLSLAEKDRLVRLVEERIIGIEGVQSVFAFAGSGGLNQNRNGSGAPLDAVGQVQIELAPWGTRPPGDEIIARIQEAAALVPGILVEVRNQEMGPAQGKPLHLRLTSDDWEALNAAAARVRDLLEATPGLVDIDDSRPLPGIDWEIAVDVEAAGRYGADVATVGAMVQMVTRGILLDTMRTPDSDDEIEIRVRFPEKDRLLSTLDTLRVRTAKGLVPLSAFIERRPVRKLGEINRFNGKRYIDLRADVAPGLVRLVSVATDPAGGERLTDVAMLREAPGAGGITAQGRDYAAVTVADPAALARWQADGGGGFRLIPVNANERIDAVTAALQGMELPAQVSWAWTGDREEQEESQAFLGKAFLGALGLMFVILLAQFNSFYNSVLVLTAVVMSIAGVMIGMLVMGQPFSIIMTGTGIVALAGIVVNNNIVLIDTFQEFRQQMPVLEAITRTAEARIRPVLLTTVTTMAGLMPMMFGISVDFAHGGYTVDAPSALWWKPLSTAVVWGLGFATLLTLIVTPALLAARHWVGVGRARLIGRLSAEERARLRLRRWAHAMPAGEILWTDAEAPPRTRPLRRLDAAE
ncbi:MAG: hypothetical protein KatS3mg118_2138 [Paracoccaceae bacterium]|nr:MAG: hypothetical protein KatS3mg118_2138 [Paracoccaceae bacterium]